MTARKSTRSTGPVYVWPEYPDDPTLGGAITAELHDELQASGAPPEPAPEPEPVDPPAS